MKITVQKFTSRVGRPPENDDLDRVNCPHAGEPGHLTCGWNHKADMPAFMAGPEKKADTGFFGTPVFLTGSSKPQDKSPLPKKYSVLMLYPDYLADQYGEDAYYAFTFAASPAEAIHAAQQEAWNKIADSDGLPEPLSFDDPERPSDFGVLLVIEGHHPDLNPGD